MAGLDDVGKAIALQVRTLKMEGQLGWIAGDDPGGVDHQHIGVEGLQVTYHLLGVDVNHVDLAQIRLNLTPRHVIPPVGHEKLSLRRGIGAVRI